jgi:hypothetical protein
MIRGSNQVWRRTPRGLRCARPQGGRIQLGQTPRKASRSDRGDDADRAGEMTIARSKAPCSTIQGIGPREKILPPLLATMKIRNHRKAKLRREPRPGNRPRRAVRSAGGNAARPRLAQRPRPEAKIARAEVPQAMAEAAKRRAANESRRGLISKENTRQMINEARAMPTAGAAARIVLYGKSRCAAMRRPVGDIAPPCQAICPRSAQKVSPRA